MNSRILIVTQNFPPENFGNASRINDLAINLVALGKTVTVLSPHPTFPFGSFKKSWRLHSSRKFNNINHLTIFTWQPAATSPSFLSRMSYYLIFPIHAIIWGLLKRKEYDVIITTSPPIFTGITGFFIKKIARKKWFFDVRDLWIDASVSLKFVKKNSFFEKISRKFEHMCFFICDGITVTTEQIKNILRETSDVSVDKIKVISNGVDTKLFTPLKIKKNRIIYSGLLGPAQQFEKFFLAIKELHKKFPIEFYIVGDGDIKKDLEALVKKEGLEGIVIFKGRLPREKIPGLIAESLIGVAPLKDLESLRYAIPTKIYEYMACGIPFIATGKGEVERLARESGAGIIAGSSVESIYEHMVNLLNNESLRDTMGVKGREFVENFYNREEITKELLRFIEK
jgi:colanic acid biosynthesis glycosyl transferase WcaI